MTRHSPDRDLTFARTLAEHVIARLGPDSPHLQVDHLGFYHGFDLARFETVLTEEPSDRILVAVRVADDPTASPMDVYFSLDTAVEGAVETTARGIQDHVLEYTRGNLLPPCPGHRHPLQTGVVDGVASWVCPSDPTHFVEPIMPNDPEN